jgi:hypothetical protein
MIDSFRHKRSLRIETLPLSKPVNPAAQADLLVLAAAAATEDKWSGAHAKRSSYKGRAKLS